jgi:hypothetical protein
MQPDERLARTPTTAQRYKIGADVKLIAASVEHEVTQTAPSLVRAYNLGTSDHDVRMDATIIRLRRLRRPPPADCDGCRTRDDLAPS